MIRPDSITTSYSAKHIMDYFKGFELLYDFLEGNDLVTRYKNDFFVYIDTNMTFYSTKIIESNMDENTKSQYLRYLLVMKMGFIGSIERVRSKSQDELLFLLKTTHSQKNIDV